jgi:hypothetical protein
MIERTPGCDGSAMKVKIDKLLTSARELSMSLRSEITDAVPVIECDITH